jgi:hypothetical protein
MKRHPKSRPIESAPTQKGVAQVHGGFTVLSTCRVPTRFLTAGLWLVAAAVVLWGLEYRLSLYHPHPGPAARASIAKLWVEPRSSLCTFAARSSVDDPNHDLPTYLAGTLQRCKAREFPFHLFVPPAIKVDFRIASASPRSPPHA